MLKASFVPLTVVICAHIFCAAPPALAQDVFDMGPGVTSLEFVPVGNLGNAGTLTGSHRIFGGNVPDPVHTVGAVDYRYSMGTYEVTAAQYGVFLNAVAGVDDYGLYDDSMYTYRNPAEACGIERYQGSGSQADPYRYRVDAAHANLPVNMIGLGDAMRFVNWLANGTPSGRQDGNTTEDGAYTLNGTTDGHALGGIVRNAGATYVLPSEDEWYKAAYHANDGTTGNYFDYATGSDVLPGNAFPDTGNNANWDGPFIEGIETIRPVGSYDQSPSPYGTFDQNGNVMEWTDTNWHITGQYAYWDQILRGGSLGVGTAAMHANQVNLVAPVAESVLSGFRVAVVPEPAAMSLLALGGATLLRRRKR